MRIHVLEREQFVPHPVPEVFAFFAAAENLERLTPPWLCFSVRSLAPKEIAENTLITYRLRVHGIPLRWVSRIEEWEPNHRFVDRQLTGPYALWHHTHAFSALSGGTLMRDTVRYAIGFGLIGELARALQIQRDLDNIFAFRRRAVREVFA